LADSYVVLSFYSILPPIETLSKAREAAREALALDESLAEAHASLGFVKTSYDWDWEGAETEYRRSIELNPSYATAHQLYAWYLLSMTRFEEALDEMREAQELNPRDVYRGLADMYLYARRYDQAIDAYQKVLEMDPGFTYAHGNLGLAYLQKSMYDEALAALQKEINLSKDLAPIFRAWTGTVYAAMGRVEDARTILAELIDRTEREYFPSSLIAWLLFALEDSDRGFAWLDRAFEERDGWLQMIKAYRAYDGVRDDPRYEDFLHRMGLEP
jgi:tetratricopeptide (TPR) repeat protein